MLKFSIIIPVYNRPDEVFELLESLVQQSYRSFEVLVVEDGSQQPSKQQVQRFVDQLEIHYFSKPNTGPGDSRNFGAAKSSGDYLIFFDSDCLIPPNYLETVDKHLDTHKLDVFGGPDRAHESFTTMQKGINYAMTSLLTTGGIRGHRRAANTFQPRSFNMGISSQAFEKAGGFSNLHPGEDPDLVYKLSKLGVVIGLIPDAYVYHKRRIDLKKFSQQVYKFGLARTILMKWHPASRKLVFWLPTLALLTGLALLLFSWQQAYFWLAVLFVLMVLFIDALRSTGSVPTSMIGVVATVVQVIGYGWGFLKGWCFIHVLGRNPMRQFPEMFKGQKSNFSN